MKQLIGKGTFTKCYRVSKRRVELHSVDPIKECMALGWFPDSYLFPEVERVESEVYSMKYYERKASLKNNLSKRQWELYNCLRDLKVDYSSRYKLHSHWHKAFSTIPAKFKAEREALRDALDACSNYGSDIAFEISPRNVATQGNKIVLLDCFFVLSKLDELRSDKRVW